MRSNIPTVMEVSPLMGVTTAGWNTISIGQDIYWQGDVEELWAKGMRHIRVGGTDPAFTNATAAGKAIALRYKAKGFNVEIGMTFVNKTGTAAGKFNTAAQAPYLAQAVAFAQWCQDNEMYAFMIENEVSSLLEITEITQAQYKTWIRDVVAPACRAVAPDVLLVVNETASQIATWSALGKGSYIDKLGFNIYGGSQSDLSGFTNQVNSIVSGFPAGDAYVSEWNAYFDWDQVTFDQAIQKTYIADRLRVLNASGLTHLFYVYKSTNTNGASVWNDFAAAWSPGTPNNTSMKWLKRKLHDALFPDRPSLSGETDRSLDFDGTASAILPITQSGGGFSTMFWYNRFEYFNGERFVLSNVDITESYRNGFRLYHDPNRDIAFNTNNESGSNGFNVINALTGGVWNHMAITIAPGAGKALLYINGVKAGNALSGFVGSPLHECVFGGRIPDGFGKPKFHLRGLVAQNINDPFTHNQILAHMRQSRDTGNGGVPAGASWYDFNISTDDQSGNGNDLVTTSTTYFTEDVPATHDVSGTRENSGARTDTP